MTAQVDPKAETLTIEEAERLLVCDPVAGTLHWRVAPRRGIAPGTRFGRLRKDGYREGAINGVFYMEHRLIWFMANRAWPPAFSVDHINRVRNDNRLCNLRLATRSQNGMNTTFCRSVSGRRGVSQQKCGRWRAVIKLEGRVRYLGLFESIEEASAARDAAARRVHGEFIPKDATP